MAGHTAGKRIPGHLPPQVRRRVLPPRAEHQRQRLLPRRREREPDPPVGAAGARSPPVARSSSARPSADAAAGRGVGTAGEGQAGVHADRARARRGRRLRRARRLPWSPVIRWGDPLFSTARRVRPERADRRSSRSASSATTTTTSTSSRRRPARGAVLVANQEYTNENIMFPPATTPEQLDEQRRIAMAAHGMAVVQLYRTRKGKPWTYAVGAPLNRRITGSTPFTFSGAGRRLGAAADGRGPDGHDRARHARQLRGRHDPVGHGAVRRGELQRLLPHRRHQRRRPALRPRGQGDHPRLGVDRPAVRRARPRATRTSRTGSAGSSRSTRSTRTRRR